jgi:hypothetical protein
MEKRRRGGQHPAALPQQLWQGLAGEQQLIDVGGGGQQPHQVLLLVIQGFDLIALAPLQGFRPQPLRDIAEQHHRAADLPLFPDRCADAFHREMAAVPADEGVHAAAGLAPLQGAVNGAVLLRIHTAVRMMVMPGGMTRQADEVFPGIAEQPGRGGVDEGMAAIPVNPENALTGGFQNGFVEVFQPFQLQIRALDVLPGALVQCRLGVQQPLPLGQDAKQIRAPQDDHLIALQVKIQAELQGLAIRRGQVARAFPPVGPGQGQGVFQARQDFPEGPAGGVMAQQPGGERVALQNPAAGVQPPHHDGGGFPQVLLDAGRGRIRAGHGYAPVRLRVSGGRRLPLPAEGPGRSEPKASGAVGGRPRQPKNIITEILKHAMLFR